MNNLKSASTLTVVNFELKYHRHETMPERLSHRAASIGISPEQLIRRLITDGMRDYVLPVGPCQPATTLSEYLANSGALITDH